MWRVARKGGRRVEGADRVRRLLGGRRVAVDLSIWIVQALPSSTGRFVSRSAWDPDSGDPPPRTERVDVLRTLFFRTLALRQMGCTPLFCADGQAPSAKDATRIERRGGTVRDGCGGGAKMPRNAGWQFLEAKAVELLEALGMRVVRARGEAEALCAWMARSGLVDMVLSRDSDALVYGAPIVVKELDLFGAQTGRIGAEVYSLALLEEQGGIDRAGLLVACVLQGNDYDQGRGVERVGWKGVRRLLVHLRSRVFGKAPAARGAERRAGVSSAEGDPNLEDVEDEDEDEDEEGTVPRMSNDPLTFSRSMTKGRPKKFATTEDEPLAIASPEEISRMTAEADERRLGCAAASTPKSGDIDEDGIIARQVLRRMVEDPDGSEGEMLQFFGLHTRAELRAIVGGAARAPHCTRCGLEGMKNKAGSEHERCEAHPGARPRAKARESACRCAWHLAMRRLEALDWEKPLRRTLERIRHAAKGGMFAPEGTITLFSEAGSAEMVLRREDLKAWKANGPQEWSRSALSARPRAPEGVLARLLAEDEGEVSSSGAVAPPAVSHLDLKILSFSASDAIDRALGGFTHPGVGDEALPVPALVLKAVDNGAAVLVGWAAPGSGAAGAQAIEARVQDAARRRLLARGPKGTRPQGRPLAGGLPGTKPEALADNFDLRCFTTEYPERIRHAFPRLWEAFDASGGRKQSSAVPTWSRRIEDFPGFQVVAKAPGTGTSKKVRPALVAESPANEAPRPVVRPPPSPGKRRVEQGFRFGRVGELPSEDASPTPPPPGSPGKRGKHAPVAGATDLTSVGRSPRLSLEDLLSDGLEEKAAQFMRARQGGSVLRMGCGRVTAPSSGMPACSAPADGEPDDGTSRTQGRLARSCAATSAASMCDVIDLTQD